MFDKARIREDFNDAAERYDAHAALQQKVLQRLLARIPPGGRQMILDAGCGTGTLARHLERPVIAIDNAYRMCVQASHSGNLPVTGDMDKLPFADSSFDLVFSSLALQWSLDWRCTFQEWQRVLKPSGILAFSTFGAGSLQELAASFREIDGHRHISQFISAHDIADAQCETFTEYFPDVLTLARHLKALGARNKEQGRRPALMTPRQMKRVEAAYAKTYGTAQGLPVSWNIIYAVTQKP